MSQMDLTKAESERVLPMAFGALALRALFAIAGGLGVFLERAMSLKLPARQPPARVLLLVFDDEDAGPSLPHAKEDHMRKARDERPLKARAWWVGRAALRMRRDQRQLRKHRIEKTVSKRRAHLPLIVGRDLIHIALDGGVKFQIHALPEGRFSPERNCS